MSINSFLAENSDEYVIYYRRRPRITDAPAVLVEPATITAVVSAAVEYFKSKDDSQWKANVSAKLDIIIAKLDVLIEELRNLKVWLKEHDLDEARRILNEEIEARRKTVEDIITGIGGKGNNIDEKTKDRLVDQLDHIRVAVDRLSTWSDYGFVYFTGIISGTLTVLLIMDLIGIPTGERNSFAKRINSGYLGHSIDDANTKSLASARNHWALEAGNRRNKVSSLLNREWLTNLHETVRRGHGPDGIETITYRWVTQVTGGDPDAVLTVNRANTGGGFSYPNLDVFPDSKVFDTGETELAKQDILSRLTVWQNIYFEAVGNEGRTAAYVRDIVNTMTKLSELYS